ncbi:GMC oxidoreductase, partial [Atractiella rhizophila]
VHARKLVVLSAGALASPLILEQSGVGKREVLGSAGVEVKVDNAGVGEKYLFRLLIVFFYFIVRLQTIHTFCIRSTRILWVSKLVSAKITMTLEDVKGTSPTFQQHWKECFADYPDKAQAWIGFATNCLGDPTALGEGPFSPLVRDLSKRMSLLGSIHISDLSPDSAPNFKAAFTSEEQIIDTLVWIYKKWRTVNRQLSFYRREPATAHPKFSNTSPAATQDYAEVPAENHTVVYLEEDEVALREFVVEKMASVLHPAGTCAMGSALDSDLNVISVKNLKVADLSVIPSHIGGNPYAVACMIGEKAASIVAKGKSLFATRRP